MKRYFQTTRTNPHLTDAIVGTSMNNELPDPTPETSLNNELPETPVESPMPERVENEPETICDDSDLPELPSDPADRPPIANYHPNIRERVRRKYIMNGPCQPMLNDFPQTLIRGKMRRFNKDWYKEFNWLEYSTEKDAAFCLCCYLFKNEIRHQGGGDAFVGDGFDDWSSKSKLHRHKGGLASAHTQASDKCLDLMNQKQHIETVIVKTTDEAKKNYRAQLNATIDCIKWLLRQRLAFRGHNESQESNNQGNFLELLKFLADHSEDVRKVVLKNAPANLRLTSSRIQKDIVSDCAYETTKSIIEEIGDSFFCVLLDDSCDVSTKEQMAVVLRFVDKTGRVLERILGFRHVESTTSHSLKYALEDLLKSHGLDISRLRGQGYDGASNMKGEFNGLKALILEENETAYYVDCFAHQLQLALVAVAKNHVHICELFVLITNVVNVVGGSCKRKDSLREQQAAKIVQGLENDEIISGQGLNQESTLIRPSDTRWSSHYKTILNLINLFDSIIVVLRKIVKDGLLSNQRGEASRLIRDMLAFDFVFDLHLMKSILGITNELCLALQRKDQDIVSAMNLVGVSKDRLQTMRDSGWEDLIDEVSNFCVSHKIVVPVMDDLYVDGKRRKWNDGEMTNDHRYRVEVFTTVIDLQWVELKSRFNEVNTELLLCVACLNPSHSFKDFDKKKLVRLVNFYPKDFEDVELLALPDQLENFYRDVSVNFDTSDIHGIGGLSQKMVGTGRHLVYPSVYRLIKLALVLPVATATV